MPALFIFQDLVRSIKQLEAWQYDDQGKPIKKDDDMCENLYRLVLLGTVWEELKSSHDENIPTKKDVDNVTGY